MCVANHERGWRNVGGGRGRGHGNGRGSSSVEGDARDGEYVIVVPAVVIRNGGSQNPNPTPPAAGKNGWDNVYIIGALAAAVGA